MATLNYNLGSLPLQGGNRIDLIPGYHDAIAAMTAEVAAARSTVEVEFYIAAWDDVTGPVLRGAGRGHRPRRPGAAARRPPGVAGASRATTSS